MSTLGKVQTKHEKAAELKERLKKWREQKEAKGKGPLKRPLGQINNPVSSIVSQKSSINQDWKRPRPTTQFTNKPIAVVKPHQQDSAGNRENLAVNIPAKTLQTTKETEELKKRLEEWREKKAAEKSTQNKNRRLTFIPSGKPKVENTNTGLTAPTKPPTDINRRQTISITNPSVLKRSVVQADAPSHRVVHALTGRKSMSSHFAAQRDAVKPTTLAPVKRSSPRFKRAPTAVTNRIPAKRAADPVKRSSPRLKQCRPLLSTKQEAVRPGTTQKRLHVPAYRVPLLAATTQKNATTSRTTNMAKRNPIPHVKHQSNLAKRQSPRGHARVKRLSVATSQPLRLKEHQLQRSLPPAASKTNGSRPIGQGIDKKTALKHRKSILKPQPLSQDAIEEVEEGLTDPPHVEVRGTGVRFTIPGGTPITPSTPHTATKRKPMTPQQARRQKLNEWLEAKGKTPSRFRHLCCFDEQLSAKKKKITRTKPGLTADELNKQQSQIDQEMKVVEAEPVSIASLEKEFTIEVDISMMSSLCSPPAKKTRRDSILEEDIPVDTQSEDDLKSMLSECAQLHEAGCPSESVMGWLDDIAKHYEGATRSAAYWICRALILEEEGDDHITVDVYEQACRNNAQPASDLANALQTFVQRMEKRAKKKAKAASTPRHLQQVQQENTFQSSSIKYSISDTTPFFKKLHRRADHEGTPMSVITPVRRSTRRSLATLPEMLRDHDVIVERLEDIPKVDQSNTLFLPNRAITEDDMDAITDTILMLSPVPVERSLTAEFEAAAEDGMLD